MAQTTVSMPASWRSSTPGPLDGVAAAIRFPIEHLAVQTEARRGTVDAVEDPTHPPVGRLDQHGEIRAERRPLLVDPLHGLIETVAEAGASTWLRRSLCSGKVSPAGVAKLSFTLPRST